MRQLMGYIHVANLRRLIAVTFLLMMAMSYKGWLPGRIVPMSGFIGGGKIEYLIIILYACSLLWMVFYPQRWGAVCLVIISSLLWISVDVNRFHPIYMQAAVLVLAPVTMTRFRLNEILRLILGLTFLFAALNRINPLYFLQFMELFKGFTLDTIKTMVIALSVLEGALGLGVIVLPRNRLILILVGLAQLSFVGLLLYSHWNFIAVLWNLMMLGVVVFCWYCTDLDEGNQSEVSVKLSVYAPTLVLIVILTMSYLDVINRVFSFQLYSGDSLSVIVMVDKAKLSDVPDPYNKYIRYLDKEMNNPFINIDLMMSQEYGLQLYPTIINALNCVKPFKYSSFNEDEFVVLIRTGHDFEVGSGVTGYLKSDL